MEIQLWFLARYVRNKILKKTVFLAWGCTILPNLKLPLSRPSNHVHNVNIYYISSINSYNKIVNFTICSQWHPHAWLLLKLKPFPLETKKFASDFPLLCAKYTQDAGQGYSLRYLYQGNLKVTLRIPTLKVTYRKVGLFKWNALNLRYLENTCITFSDS